MRIKSLSRYFLTGLSALCVLCSVGCGGTSFQKKPAIPDDRQPIPEPKTQHINIAADIIAKQFADQLEQSLDLSRQLRNLTGKRKQAYNIDSFGEVPNSSWFTNRNAHERLSVDEVRRGPDTETGPPATGTWTVIRAKTEGVTPGFHIEDSRGEKYVMKFDPKGYSELATGAELVGTKLFHAAGYNVPENYLVWFDPSVLKIGSNVEITDKEGRQRLMQTSDLQEILERIEKQSDGRIRAVASRYVRGKLKGPFYYIGTRDDDPNDFIPHQHRRELRGLRVMAAWLNHFDTKANNTLDVYDPAGFIKHYLIDFGSTLGSQGDEPMPPYIGYEESVDIHEILKSTASLGMFVEPWEKVGGITYPAIGHYRSYDFKPERYKFILPNPAFELMTHRDGYWGAKMVMSFSDEQIRAAVSTAQYSNPEAAEYLIRTIIERRDIIGQYWFEKMPPLDFFAVEPLENKDVISFRDLAIDWGVGDPEKRAYRYVLQSGSHVFASGEVDVANLAVLLPSISDFEQNKQKDYLHLQVFAKTSQNGAWSQAVHAFMEPDKVSGQFRLAGVQREE